LLRAVTSGRLEDAMKVHLELVRRGKNVLEVLASDGWSLENDGDSYAIHHRNVADEVDARRRLTQLGVLTSRWVRIEFERMRAVRPNFTEDSHEQF
jgi:hypothetical protein